MRILLVDDSAEVGELFNRMLRKLGHDVVVSQDPEEALDLMGADIDGVISDIEMPKMNGVQMASAMRKKYEALPICFCTGSDPADEVVKQASAIGRVVPKDGRQETLRAILLELTRQRAEQRSTRPWPVRRWPRVKIALNVKLRYEDLEAVHQAVTLDVSRGGLLIETPRQRKPGTPIRATVFQDDPFASFALDGRVVRLVETGLAIEITKPGPDWESFCRDLRPGPG